MTSRCARCARARRPVLLAGAGAVRSGATGVLAELAAHAGLPVVVGAMAKGVLAEDSPWYAGTLDMAGHQVIWELLASADLIVTAGFDPVELITPWRLPVPVLHVDAVPNTDQVYPAAIEVVGSVATALAWFLANVGRRPPLVGGGGRGAPGGAAGRLPRGVHRRPAEPVRARRDRAFRRALRARWSPRTSGRTRS